MIENYSLLDPLPSNPAGFVTKDGMWAAVPWGKKFVIIHNGQQVHTSNTFDSAKAYIQKEVKLLKKKVKGPLDEFL